MARPWHHTHVSAIVKLASPLANKPYAHRICACDSQNYCPPAYGGFTWEIYVRYNKIESNIRAPVLLNLLN